MQFKLSPLVNGVYFIVSIVAHRHFDLKRFKRKWLFTGDDFIIFQWKFISILLRANRRWQRDKWMNREKKDVFWVKVAVYKNEPREKGYEMPSRHHFACCLGVQLLSDLFLLCVHGSQTKDASNFSLLLLPLYLFPLLVINVKATVSFFLSPISIPPLPYFFFF